jgi:NAD(P)-dependent dehydrogenase (short-subunit alcohol dehydrogenase family)
MSKRLEGRVAVITGAGSGIGYATAVRLAAEGAKVVVADTNEETGKKVATEVGGLFVKCDVTNEAQVANLYKVAFDTYNRIDIAFNNAGISPPDDDSILITGLDAWERVLRVNTTSYFYVAKQYFLICKKLKRDQLLIPHPLWQQWVLQPLRLHTPHQRVACLQ